MRVAIVHPWFLEIGGAERVIEVIAEIYPDADIFAFSANSNTLPDGLKRRKIFLSKWSGVLARFRFRRAALMILFPWLAESMDLSSYDLVITSCPPLMGINVGQGCTHVCYCHSPQRAWWNLYSQRQNGLRWPVRQIFRASAIAIRLWEFCAAQRIDYIIANSNYISARIWKYFRRESTVIYPPVNAAIGHCISEDHADFYLSVSRLDVDKGVDLLIQACNRLGRRLVVVGTGRKERELRAIAGSTIEFRGRIPDSELPNLYSKCRAFLFAADEDFGIAPVEAQAYGRPVIAYGHGGSLETVRVGDRLGRPDTGVFFGSQTIESVINGILEFEKREHLFAPEELRAHALAFDVAVFKRRLKQFFDDVASTNPSVRQRRSITPDGSRRSDLPCECD